MDKLMEAKLDAALAGLADEVRAASPGPGADLVGRVLSDAADISAGRPVPVAPARRAIAVHRLSVLDVLLGWTGGAIATMVLGLGIGIGLGMELETGDMPMMADADEEVVAFVDPTLATDDVL